MTRSLKLLGYLLAACAVLVFFGVARPPSDSLLVSHLFDAGHVIVFGVLAWIGLGLWRVLTHRERRWEGYAVVFLSVVALGTLTEVLQIWSPRRAEVLDVVRNVAGAAGFLLMALAWERPRDALRSAWMFALAAVILLAVFLPPLRLASAHVWRSRAFPVLVDYASPWAKPLWKVGDAEVAVGPVPERFGAEEGSAAAQVTFGVATYPRLTLLDPYPDWSQSRVLAFEVYSDLDSTMTMYIRIHDQDHREQLEDRYNNRIAVRPGVNRVRLRLEDIARAPATRRMDLSRMDAVSVFAVRPPEPFTLWFSPFRLE